MKEPNMFQKSTPWYAWLLVVMAGLILLLGSPLVLRSKANPAEPVDAARSTRSWPSWKGRVLRPA